MSHAIKLHCTYFLTIYCSIIFTRVFTSFEETTQELTFNPAWLDFDLGNLIEPQKIAVLQAEFEAIQDELKQNIANAQQRA